MQNQERSDCTLGLGRLIPIVFLSLACSRFAPGSVKILASKTRSCSFATQRKNLNTFDSIDNLEVVALINR
jgi:hypothetical protein